MTDHVYAFCVDSDGCAMDTMTYKHQLFFGPLAAEVFGVPDQSAFLKEWDRLNLYSQTRGVNRFVGLVMALEWAGVTGIDHLKAWVEETTSLSNQSLEIALEERPSEDLRLALDWSRRVNQGIQAYEGEALAFPGALAGLERLSQLGQVYVVSSANKEAVQAEWQDQGLMSYVTDLYCQDRGKKEEAIAQLRAQGYPADHILMVGDSPGDLVAAEANGVTFYPILVGQEATSWDRLRHDVADDFVTGAFTAQTQTELKTAFWQNLAE